MAKFSQGFMDVLSRTGTPQAAMQQGQQAAPAYGSLQRNLGAAFNMDQRSRPEMASAEIDRIDPKANNALIQSLAVQAKYEQDPQKKMVYMLEIDKINKAAAELDQALAAQKKEEKLEKKRQEVKIAFTNSLSTALQANGQTSAASLVAKIPDFESIPAAAQERFLALAGITDPEDARKALSTEGKRAADMGFVVGTPAFQEQVKKQTDVTNQGLDAEALNAIRTVLSDTVDIKQTHRINDAVIAMESSGLEGADALQENALLDLIGDKGRAVEAVRRFSESAGLVPRLSNSLSMWLTGEKTETNKNDREMLLYAALKMQEESLDTAVYNTLPAIKGINEKQGKAIRNVYSFPESTKEWVTRFEKRYKASKEDKNSTTPNDAAARRAKYSTEASQFVTPTPK